MVGIKSALFVSYNVSPRVLEIEIAPLDMNSALQKKNNKKIEQKVAENRLHKSKEKTVMFFIMKTLRKRTFDGI